MEFQIRTEEQFMDREMATLTIPDKNEWAAYLNYLYNRFERTVGEPDLTAYEELEDSDSE